MKQGMALLIATFALMRSVVPVVAADIDAEEVRQINSQIQARDSGRLASLKSSIDKARTRIRSGENSLSEADKALESIDSSVQKTLLKLRSLDLDLSDTLARLAELESQADRLESDTAAMRERIGTLASSAYKAGQVPALSILLGDDPPALSQRKLSYLSYFAQDERRQLGLYNQKLTALAAARRVVAAAESALQSKRDEVAAQQRQLAEEKLEREKALTALKASLGSEQSRLSKLEADRGSLTSLVREVNTTLEKIDLVYHDDNFSRARGRLVWPITDFKASGSARAALREGGGIFMPEPVATAVHAVHGGRIVFADWLRGFGLLLIIDHGGGFMTLYGNNQALFAASGDQVRRGETVASSGSRAGNPANGLYFEIRKDGQPQNPLQWLQ